MAASATAFDWNTAYSNCPQFDQPEGQYDEYAEKISRKEQDRQAQRERNEAKAFARHMARLAELERLTSELQEDRALLLNLGESI